MRTGAAILDLDNTLVPTYATRQLPLLLLLRKWNPDLTPQALDHHWGQSFREVVESCAPTAHYDEFLQQYLELIRTEPSKLLPCAGDIIFAFDALSIPVIVFTASSRPLAQLELEKVGVADFVRLIVGFEDIPVPKPHVGAAEGLAGILYDIGLKPENSVYLGDSGSDLRIAERLGCTFLGVTTGKTSAEEFYRLGLDRRCVVSSLCEVDASSLEFCKDRDGL